LNFCPGLFCGSFAVGCENVGQGDQYGFCAGLILFFEGRNGHKLVGDHHDVEFEPLGEMIAQKCIFWCNSHDVFVFREGINSI